MLVQHLGAGATRRTRLLQQISEAGQIVFFSQNRPYLACNLLQIGIYLLGKKTLIRNILQSAHAVGAHETKPVEHR